MYTTEVIMKGSKFENLKVKIPSHARSGAP